MNKELIQQYLKGETTAAESAAMQEWLNGAGADWVDQFMDHEQDITPVTTTTQAKDAMANRVLAMVNTASQEQPVLVKPTRLWQKLTPWVAAASLLVLISLAWQFYATPAAPAITWQTYHNNQAGAVKQVRLPDNSLVYLNAASSINIPSNFNDTTREVQLTGEAFFEVAHDAKRAFIVHAGNIATRVYGTRFNIATWPDAGEQRVALQEGRIGVSSAAFAEKILTPGDLLLYNKKQDSVHVLHITAAGIGDWTTGMLSFVNTPLKDALVILEKKYGVKFQYNQQLHNPTVTASFERAPLQKVLHHLSFVWNIRFEQVNNTIYVH